MATWPTYARFETGITETRGTGLIRTETEAGPPKQRRKATRVMVRLDGAVLFNGAADVASFDAWFAATIKNGQDWFDLVHPRTAATVQARFVAGSERGALEYLSPRLKLFRLPVAVEYWSA